MTSVYRKGNPFWDAHWLAKASVVDRAGTKFALPIGSSCSTHPLGPCSPSAKNDLGSCLFRLSYLDWRANQNVRDGSCPKMPLARPPDLPSSISLQHIITLDRSPWNMFALWRLGVLYIIHFEWWWIRCHMGLLCLPVSSPPCSTLRGEIIMHSKWAYLPYYGSTTLTFLSLFFNFFNLGMTLDELRVGWKLFDKEFGLYVFISLNNL